MVRWGLPLEPGPATTGRTAKKGNIAGITWMYGGGGQHEGAEQPDRMRGSGVEEGKEGRTRRGPEQQTRGLKWQNRRTNAARTRGVGDVQRRKGRREFAARDQKDGDDGRKTDAQQTS